MSNYLSNQSNSDSLSELFTTEHYNVVEYFITSNFIELEKTKEEVIWETEDDIFSLCQNPTAIKLIKVNEYNLTDTDEGLAAFVTGLSLNPNPEIINILEKYLDCMSQENWESALKNPGASKLIEKAKSYKGYKNFKL